MLELEPILSRVDYRRVADDIYLHDGKEVGAEHYLYFARTGSDGRYLTADFGLLNKSAHKFSREMILRYGGQLYNKVRNTIEKTHCFMRFSLWRFSGMRSPRCWDTLAPDAAEQICARIEGTILGLVDTVDSKAALLSTLLGDAEPCPWFAVNSAIRAAQVLRLATELEMDLTGVLVELHAKEELVRNNLSDSQNVPQYLNAIVGEAKKMPSAR